MWSEDCDNQYGLNQYGTSIEPVWIEPIWNQYGLNQYGTRISVSVSPPLFLDPRRRVWSGIVSLGSKLMFLAGNLKREQIARPYHDLKKASAIIIATWSVSPCMHILCVSLDVSMSLYIATRVVLYQLMLPELFVAGTEVCMQYRNTKSNKNAAMLWECMAIPLLYT